jgi:His/Glu/Gln/Arg/opine family amino acid ABC transporter permease subunit
MNLDFATITNNFSFLLSGYWTTVVLTFWTVIGGYVFGTPLAVARASNTQFSRYLAISIIEIVRATPLLMLLFWIFFMLPVVTGQPVSAYTTALIALTIFNTSYSAEIIRAGIQAVHRGQTEAGLASGLSRIQVLRKVVLPQAFSTMTPAMMNQFVMVYKSTSMVYIIGVTDFFNAADIVNNREFRPIEIFLFVGIVYFIPSTCISRLSAYIARRRQIRMSFA